MSARRRPTPRNSTPLTPEALRAGFAAHKGHEHDGTLGYGCDTCRRYLAAISRAHEQRALTDDQYATELRALADQTSA